MRKFLLGLFLAIPAAHAFAQDGDKTLEAALKKQADGWDVAIVKKDRRATKMQFTYLIVDIINDLTSE